jgi:glycosyltransferase involved in cell wall biosynthesis
MEAASCGIPTIATDVGGTSEVCVDGVNGILLRKDFEIAELTRAIQLIFSLPANKYREYVKNSLNIQRQKFLAITNFEAFSTELNNIVMNMDQCT